MARAMSSSLEQQMEKPSDTDTRRVTAFVKEKGEL